MTDNNPSKKQLEELSKQIKQDQAKNASAEKRVKIKTSFKKAVKKMGQTSPPRKRKDSSHFEFGNVKYIVV